MRTATTVRPLHKPATLRIRRGRCGCRSLGILLRTDSNTSRMIDLILLKSGVVTMSYPTIIPKFLRSPEASPIVLGTCDGHGSWAA